jgi:hypothetical protein
MWRDVLNTITFTNRAIAAAPALKHPRFVSPGIGWDCEAHTRQQDGAQNRHSVYHRFFLRFRFPD